MENYTEETYGERIAEVYDQWYTNYDADAIQRLVELAAGGKALELGIGSGRFALPLSQAGVPVDGLDVSESMIAMLKAKPGGDKIQVTFGNFADVAIDGKFALVYVVFNTFYSLLTQEEQVRCFMNVAQHLTPQGVFVLESFVPDLTRFTAGQAMRVGNILENDVQIDVSEIELDKQVITSQHVRLTSTGTRFYPVILRYVWPSEMDLMAKLSHMRLRERWSDWKKSPFTGDSGKHISVYELEG